MASEEKACGCVCHKFNGILVAVLGLDFLLGQLDVISQKVVGTVWPIVVILLGLSNSIGKGKCKCCNGSGLK